MMVLKITLSLLLFMLAIFLTRYYSSNGTAAVYVYCACVWLSICSYLFLLAFFLLSNLSSLFLFYFQATMNDVRLFFHSLGAGSIEEVRVTRDKGFGFVRYSTHEEAALAIQMGNGQLIGGRQIKVSLVHVFTFPW